MSNGNDSGNEIQVVTVTVPFDCEFSADPDVARRERAAFMRRAGDRIVEAGIPYVDHFTDADTILDCFDFQTADTNEIGFVLPVLNRDCAERLLTAGMLDQTADAIIARWGIVRPSIPRARNRRRGFE